MASLAIGGQQGAFRDSLTAHLARRGDIERCRELPADGEPGTMAPGLDVAVYLPARVRPDPAAVARFCQQTASAGVGHLILVSSAAINEPSHRHLGYLSEKRLRKRPENAVARQWRSVEQAARETLADSDTGLTVLRPSAVPVAGGDDAVSRLINRRLPLTLPGYDPSLQLLSPEDLARAIAHAATGRRAGVYNVAPTGVVPLRQAIRSAGGHRLPVPRWLRRLTRKITRHAPADELEYLRYPWTVSGEKIERELGFEPRHSSARTARRLKSSAEAAEAAEPAQEFDEFGMDRDYVDRLGRTLFRFLHDVYWRVEWRGLEHLPEGKAVLAGVHRGHQPWDGVMTLHLLAREVGRYPRFLIHPTLVKFPFLAPYMIKCGGLHACQENADWVLSKDELLAIFPEGITGAFCYYRDSYKLGRFGRDEFVKIALRHGAPIVPFVTVGSAEIFPIFAKLHWRWWTRWSEWPCLPITPTMSLLPLPSKWHTLFLEPIPVAEKYGPEAAGDRDVVRHLSQQVRARMEQAIAEMLERRKSIFYGSVFDGQDPVAEPALSKGTV